MTDLEVTGHVNKELLARRWMTLPLLSLFWFSKMWFVDFFWKGRILFLFDIFFLLKTILSTLLIDSKSIFVQDKHNAIWGSSILFVFWLWCLSYALHYCFCRKHCVSWHHHTINHLTLQTGFWHSIVWSFIIEICHYFVHLYKIRRYVILQKGNEWTTFSYLKGLYFI